MDKIDLDFLLRKVKKGDEKAFESFYLETKKGLFSFLYTYCDNYQTCEDLLQETYIRVRKNIDKYQDHSNPIPWLFQIAKNVALNDLNKQKRTAYVDFDEHENMGGSYEDSTEAKDILEIINTKLPKEESRIVLLHLVDGYKNKEIAEIVGEPLGTVLWRYNKAIKTLQEILGDYR